MMSFGGACCRPGPRRSAFLGCEGIRLGSILSPGKTNIGCEAMAQGSVSGRFTMLLALEKTGGDLWIS
jgi:hypothetical protein